MNASVNIPFGSVYFTVFFFSGFVSFLVVRVLDIYALSKVPTRHMLKKCWQAKLYGTVPLTLLQ